MTPRKTSEARKLTKKQKQILWDALAENIKQKQVEEMKLGRIVLLISYTIKPL